MRAIPISLFAIFTGTLIYAILFEIPLGMKIGIPLSLLLAFCFVMATLFAVKTIQIDLLRMNKMNETSQLKDKENSL